MSYMNNNGKIYINNGPGGAAGPPPPPRNSPEYPEWEKQYNKSGKNAKRAFLNRKFSNVTKKGTNQAIRNVYESKTGQNATPGTGPANLIRLFAGVSAPKGSKGGSRKTRRLRKNSKKTRGRR